MMKLVLLFLLSLICGIATGIFYFKKESLESDKRLSLYFSVLGLIFFQTFCSTFFGLDNFHPLLILASLLFFVLVLCLPPSMYLYVVSLFKDNSSKTILKNSLAHYIPAIVLLIINIFSFISLYNLDVGSDNYILINQIRTYANFLALFFLFLIQNIFYIYLAFRLYFKRQIVVQSTQKINSNASLKWMLWFITGFTFVIISIYIFQISPLNPLKSFLRYGLLVYVLLIIFGGNKNVEFHLGNRQDEKIDSSKRAEIVKNLVDKMLNQKAYLNPNLTIRSLAIDIGTNTKYLSYVINEEFEKNFSSFVNHYRIEHSKEMLHDPEHEMFTIESIAQETGFKSKSSFNAAFKKFTNTTPSKFKKLKLD